MTASDAPIAHAGGCLCGDVRYAAHAAPLRTTICHCTFCQRATGSAFLVEPIFRAEDVAFCGAAPRVFSRTSDGSGKRVDVHFCGRCGTHLFLSFERFPGVVGLFGGTFDDPNWFDRGPAAVRHIFTRHAQKDIAVPPGVEVYADHWVQPDGALNPPRVFATATVVGAAEAA